MLYVVLVAGISGQANGQVSPLLLKQLCSVTVTYVTLTRLPVVVVIKFKLKVF